VPRQRAIELGEAVVDQAEIDPLRLTGVESLGDRATFQREIVDLLSFVYDLQHDVRASVDHELIRGDVETEDRVHERNAHDAGLTAVDALGGGPVQPTR